MGYFQRMNLKAERVGNSNSILWGSTENEISDYVNDKKICGGTNSGRKMPLVMAAYGNGFA